MADMTFSCPRLRRTVGRHVGPWEGGTRGRRHKIERARYKVTNWPEYNKALRQRGDITIWCLYGIGFSAGELTADHARSTALVLED
jgi:hypothetical protein